MCNTHYERVRKANGFTPREKDPVKRFWDNVTKSAGCWNWTAATSNGYGRYYWGDRPRQAHRIAYELEIGTIPDDLDLDHLCRNRGCVNPAHLEPVTQRVNLLRGIGFSARNAAKTHCVNGHEFTPENTYAWRNRRGCVTCRSDALARRQQRREHLTKTDRQATCDHCGAEFTYQGRRRWLCSDECRLAERRRSARDFQRRKRAG